MQFNGELFVYDALGNPTKYRGESMQWDFKNLKLYKDCGFTYDASGLRKTKTYGNVVTKYHWAGDKLIAEKRTTVHNNILGTCIPQGGMYLLENYTYIEYIYGATGILGFTLQCDNGLVQKYWYSKNIQGDITRIYESSNTLVAEYSYDAWGNHNIVTNVNNIANINPIRYRGYYFDTETGLFYLQTRYYDPETGRFISPDNVNHIHTDIPNGLNLYIYCGNNPVMFTDPTGQCWFCKAGKWINNNIIQPVGNAIGTAVNWVGNVVGAGTELIGTTITEIPSFVNGLFGSVANLFTGSNTFYSLSD